MDGKWMASGVDCSVLGELESGSGAWPGAVAVIRATIFDMAADMAMAMAMPMLISISISISMASNFQWSTARSAERVKAPTICTCCCFQHGKARQCKARQKLCQAFARFFNLITYYYNIIMHTHISAVD